MVYNSLIDSKKRTEFTGISDKEMHYRLHISKVHLGITISKSRDVCKMTGHAVKKSADQRRFRVFTMRARCNKSMRKVLSDHCSSSTELESLLQGVNKAVDEKTERHHKSTDSRQKISHPTSHTIIWRSYVDGPNSTFQNLDNP